MNTSLPQDVPAKRWFDIFWNAKGWIVLVGFTVTAVLSVASWRAYDDARLLAADGRWLSATVMDKREGSGGRRARNYQFQLRFDQDGLRYRPKRQVPKAIFDAYDPPSQIDIFASASDPFVLEFTQGATREKAKNFQWMGLAAGLMSCVALWFLGSKANRATLARRKGRASRATVTAITEPAGFPRQRHGLLFEPMIVHFQTKDGLVGQSLAHEVASLQDVEIGEEIEVFIFRGTVWWDRDTGSRPNVPRQFPNVPRV